MELFAEIYDCFKEDKNIYIVPYFCYEYCVLSYLVDFEGLVLKQEETDALRLNISYRTLNGFKNTRSFEGFCKGLYNSYIKKYLSLKICEKQGAQFVSEYTAYLENEVMTRYVKGIRVSEGQAVRLFLRDFDRALVTLGINLSKNKDYLYMKNI